MALRALIDTFKKKKDEVLQDNEGWFRQGKFTPSNFWSSKISQPLVKAQEYALKAQNTPRVELPKFQIKNPVGNFVANLPVNIAEDYANIPRNLLVSTTRAGDLLGSNIGAAIGTQPKLSGPQMTNRLVSTLAPLGEAALDIYTPSVGKNVVQSLGKQAVVQAAKKGALTGALMGGSNATLAELGRSRDQVDYRQAAKSGLIGTLAGSLLGGAIGGGSAAYSQLVRQLTGNVKRINPKLTTKQAEAEAKRYIQIEGGRMAGSRPKYKNAKDVQFIGDLRQSIGLSRTGDELPQLGQSVRKLTQEEHLARSSTPTDIIQEAKAQIGSVPTKADKPLKQQLSDFYTNWVNRFQPLEDVANRIEKDLGASILPEKNPVYTTRRLLGAGGVAEYRHKKVLEPILSELGDIPSSDFDVFLKAKRDLNLGARGKVGSDATKAQQVIDALGSQYDLKQMEAVAGKLYAYQDEGLNMLREAGLISDEAFATIKNTSENYVPFQRVMDEVDNYLGLPTKKGYVGSSPIKKIKGSERQILSPVESIIANTYKIESAVSRNRVAQSLVNLRQIAPQYADMFEKVSKDSADTIAVWEEGKKNFYRVGEDIARSIKGLNEENVGILTKILSAPAQLLRQGATGRNIDFMIPNVFKDQFDAAITSKYGYKPFVDYFRGLGHLLNYKRTGSDQLVEEWMKSGGSIFFENLGGRKQLSEQIADATTKKGVLRQLKDWAIGGIDTIGELSETPTRLGLYQRAKEATGNEWLSMMESREGTLDFARMGAKMKVFNSIIPFLNVDVQGFDKLIRSVKDHPGKMALNMTIYAGMPQLLISLYNNVFHPDEYSNVPQWEKDTNFVVVTGMSKDGTPQYLKIPKGNIVPLIANPTDQLVSYLAGNDKQGFGKFALSLLSDTLPIVEGGSNLQEVFTKTLGSNLPQAIKPVFENAFNKSTFYTDEQGKPQDIVPYYMENKPPSQQFKKSTPEAYKALGKILNVSPLKAQNLLEGYLSGFVKTPTNITQILKDVSQGKNIDPNKVPIMRRFYGEREDFYTNSAKTDDSRFAASAAEPNLLQRLFKRGVKEEEVQELPADPKALGVIYNEARKDFDAYEDKKLKIEYGNYETWEKQSKLETLDQEYQFAKRMVERIEKEQPEAVFKMNLDLHASSGSKTVEERSTWAASELGKASDQKQFDALVEQMLEAKVLTKSVAEALREQGIPIDRYTEGGKIRTLSGSGKKLRLSAPPSLKLSQPTIRLAVSQPKLKAIRVAGSQQATPSLRLSPPKRSKVTISRPKGIKLKG